MAELTRQVDAAENAPRPLRFRAGPEPVSGKPLYSPAHGALHFDLGAPLPLSRLDLQFRGGTRVAPVRIEYRLRAEDPWRELAQAVFYRLERGEVISTSAPLTVEAVARFVRVTPDERSSALDAAQTVLVAEANLATLVFAAQGRPPYRLLAGAPDGSTGALPLESVVPSLESERSRFGEAALGEWTEDVAVAQQIAAQRRAAALRPWVLWSVLLAGVGGLVVMVWRLARPSS